MTERQIKRLRESRLIDRETYELAIAGVPEAVDRCRAAAGDQQRQLIWEEATP